MDNPNPATPPVAPPAAPAPATPAPSTPAPPATPPPTAEMPYMDKDGQFQEGWKNHYLPEDLRAEKIYDKVKGIKDTLTQLAIVDKLVGRKGVLLPTEASGKTEWDNFFNTIGRPATAEDYALDFTEEEAGIKDAIDDDLVKEARGIFHAIGLRQDQVNALWDFEKRRIAMQDKLLDEFEQEEHDACVADLQKEWGGAYDENVHLVNRVIEENTTGETKEKLLANYANDPIFGKFACEVAKKFMEHGVITNVETPFADLEEEKSKLMQSEAYTDRKHPDHKKVVDRVQAIFTELAKKRPTGIPA